MDFNPMTLLPLIMGNGKEGANPDMQKMLGMLTSMQSGNTDALLDMLGGDEKTKNIISLMKGMKNGGVGRDENVKTEPQQKAAQPFGLNNDEITRALSALMAEKHRNK